MIYNRFFLILLIFLLRPIHGYSQQDNISVSIQTGQFRNLTEDFYRDLPKYAFYPEAELDVKVLELGAASLLETHLSLYGSYWDDGIRSVSESCADCYTYSHSAPVIGVRVSLVQDWLLIPVGRSQFTTESL